MYNKVVALSDEQVLHAIRHLVAQQHPETFLHVAVPHFDPLTNSDHFLTVMGIFDVERTWEPYELIGWSYRAVEYSNEIMITETPDNEDDVEISMQRAYCLAVILNGHPDYKLPLSA